MAAENAPRDGNFVPTALFQIDGAARGQLMAGQIDQGTGRILVDNAGGGSGTVTDVSVVSANGFAGTVANSTTTPAITLSTTITGLLKGNGTAISAASAGTDYTNLAFKTLSVSGQSDVVAASAEDTLTLAAGSNVTITTNAGTKTVTIASSGGASGLTVGTTTITSGTTTRILYDNAGVLGEYTLTGSGTVVAMQTSPTFVTDITTPVVKLSGTSNQAVFQSGGVTGTLTWTPTSTNKTITFPDRTLTVDNITTSTTTNGTGFVKGNGSVVSFDNSTYITGLTIGSTAISSGTSTRILYDNAGTLGEYTITGSGTVVMMGTSPTVTTSLIMADAANIVVNATTGTKIGTATTQKIGFFNATPIVQPTGDTVTALQNLGLGASLTVAANTITSRTLWGQTYDGSGNVSGSLSAVGNITGGASSMTILAGTGASRTLTFQTTTSGSTATTALTLNADQSATFAGAISNSTSGVLTTGTIELGAASDTTISRSAAGVIAVESVVIPSISSTNTLTNKRVTRRLVSVNAPGATPTTNTDNNDIAEFTGLNAAITSMTTNLSGTPVNGDLLEFRFVDDGTARAITWGTSFANGGLVNLPTTTVISTMLRVLVEYQTTASLNKWVCIAVA